MLSGEAGMNRRSCRIYPSSGPVDSAYLRAFDHVAGGLEPSGFGLG